MEVKDQVSLIAIGKKHALKKLYQFTPYPSTKTASAGSSIATINSFVFSL